MHEKALTRIAGPFTNPPLPNFVVSPIGVVPKKAPGKFRIIHHLSYPKDLSINAGISKHYTTVRYHTVDMAIKVILQIGQGAFLAKTDIKSAFRLLPVSPEDYHLLGFFFQNQFYYDKVMPMGLSISCQIFEEFSSALQWIAQNRGGVEHMLHILDDFLFISPSEQQSHQDLESFKTICDQLGVPLAPEKTEGPAKCLAFAGIELDTTRLEARLPAGKLHKYTALAHEHSRKKKATLREMQSLIGALNHCCYIIPMGRAFLRRLIDLTKGITQPHHHIRYTNEARADLKIWATFLDQFNGRAMLLPDSWDAPEVLLVYTDASHTLGFGAVFGNKWFSGTWPDHWQQFHINLLELFPILAAMYAWTDEFANKRVIFYTDNIAIMHILNKAASKDTLIMRLMRPLVLRAMKFNIFFKSLHIAGLENRSADALSRLQFQEFRRLNPSAHQAPSPVPPECTPTILIPP